MAYPHLRSGRSTRLVALCLLGTFLLSPFVAATNTATAAQITVAWNPSTDPGLAGYKIYWGTVSGNYSWSADAGTRTTCTVPNLTEGVTYYFAATAYDGTRTESAFSNELSHTVPTTCTSTIAPTSQSFNAGGGTGTIAVTTGSTCSWTTSNTPSWITISSGTAGRGNGTVAYTVAANTGTASRNAGLTIAGQVLNITQTGVQTYTINASAGANGTISPSGQVSVTSGANLTFRFAPASGYKVANVLVNGSSVGALSSYTFSNVTASQTVQATFTQTSRIPPGLAKKR
jgi:hypothetical protein